MAILDNAPRASFDKLEFPFTSRTASLEARTHVHEYPKMAGGAVEKLGRKLWTFTFDCPFHDGNPFFPDLYPGTLNKLVELAAKLDTAKLVVPEIGEIFCIITKLDRRRAGKIKSGEEVTLTFLEDDLKPVRPVKGLSSVGLAAQAKKLADLSTAAIDAAFVEKKASIPAYREPMGNLLDCLSVFATVRNQTDLYGVRAQAQLAQVTSLTRQVHDLFTPASLDPVRQLLRSIWDSANTLQAIGQGEEGEALRPYVVPRTMSVGAIAQSLYGVSDRGGEILSNNRPAITDPFAVRAGTKLLTAPR